MGSITHCTPYIAASVAFYTSVRSIGIDAAFNSPLAEGVLSIIASKSERSQLARRAEASANWDVVLFSAKESIFKACYPVTKQWLDFSAAEVELDLLFGQFSAALRPASWNGQRIWGWFGIKGPLILTTVVLRHQNHGVYIP